MDIELQVGQVVREMQDLSLSVMKRVGFGVVIVGYGGVVLYRKLKLSVDFKDENRERKDGS